MCLTQVILRQKTLLVRDDMHFLNSDITQQRISGTAAYYSTHDIIRSTHTCKKTKVATLFH